MRYLLTLEILTHNDPATITDVEDAAYMACNEIAECHPGWWVDILIGPIQAEAPHEP